jgi:hypothetical protein
MKTLQQLVYADSSTIGIGYIDGAPVVTGSPDSVRHISVAYAQIGEAVLTRDGWYHVNDSGLWSQEESDSDCGQFAREYDTANMETITEDAAHLVRLWMDTAKHWKARGHYADATLLYKVAEELSHVESFPVFAEAAQAELRKLDALVLS